MSKTLTHILEIRRPSPDTFVLRLERNGFEFVPGQYLVLHIPGTPVAREYSIYSGSEDSFIELLIKEVPEGEMTALLRTTSVGRAVEIEGPFGFFILNQNNISAEHYYFIATGSGVSPFHSFIRSYRNLQYTLVYGVRSRAEVVDPDHYRPDSLVVCTSQSNDGDFAGRVSRFLKEGSFKPGDIFYLCGGSQMISEVTDLLTNKGVLPVNIRTEAFY